MKKKASEIIRSCLKEKKMTQKQIAAEMGEDVRSLNQQLKRYSDMKVERFTDVLERIGYRVEVVDNNGVRKISAEMACEILEKGTPHGLYYVETDEGYVGIDGLGTEVKLMCIDNIKNIEKRIKNI